MTRYIRERVRHRAGDRCEYCRLPQRATPDTTFHVEHIIAQQHGGRGDLANLALACDRCNFLKGPNLSAIDPQTQAIVRLFDPRRDQWPACFDQVGYTIVGLTDIGRATVHLLGMNADRRVRLRRVLQLDLTLS